MGKGFEYTGNPKDQETVNRWMDKMEEWFLGLRNDFTITAASLQDQITAITPEPEPVVDYSTIIGTDGGTFIGTDDGGMVGAGL